MRPSRLLVLALSGLWLWAAGPRVSSSDAGPLLEAKVEPRAGGSPAVVQRPAKGAVLIAAESLVDPNFARTVVLLLAYGEQGAMGVIINRRTELSLAALLPDLSRAEERVPRLYLGGPVSREQVLLLIAAPEPPEHSQQVLGGVYASSSMVTLEQLIAGRLGEEEAHAYVGYAGWAAGQLDTELARGDWHLAPGLPEHVFAAEPGRLWQQLIRKTRGRWVRSSADEEPQPATRLGHACLRSSGPLHAARSAAVGPG
jgi:putative transcriptional regulator